MANAPSEDRPLAGRLRSIVATSRCWGDRFRDVPVRAELHPRADRVEHVDVRVVLLLHDPGQCGRGHLHCCCHRAVRHVPLRACRGKVAGEQISVEPHLPAHAGPTGYRHRMSPSSVVGAARCPPSCAGRPGAVPQGAGPRLTSPRWLEGSSPCHAASADVRSVPRH